MPESIDRIFTPEDSDAHVERQLNENEADYVAPKQESRHTPAENDNIRREAVRHALNPESQSEGIGVTNVLALIESEALKNKSPKEIIRNVAGYANEILTQTLKYEDCETLYKGPASIVPKGEIKTAYELMQNQTGYSRKDIALINDFINKYETDELTKNELESLKNDVINVYANRNQIQDLWRQENRNSKFQAPGGSGLVRWYINHEGRILDSKKTKAQNKIIDSALKYISHPDRDKEPEKYVKSLIEYEGDPPYISTILPDSLIIGSSGKLEGAVEVKAYLPEEVKALVKTLEEVEKLESQRELPGSKEEGVRLSKLSKYNRQGLSVTISSEEFSSMGGMRLGADIDGIRKFITISNSPDTSQSLKYDMVDSVTGEVHQEEFEHPVILRLPRDVADEDIKKLGGLSEKFGYKNVIIQKIPFGSNDINMLAYTYFSKMGLENERKTREESQVAQRLKDRFPGLIETLKDDKLWFKKE